jgi:hypothetical protein
VKVRQVSIPPFLIQKWDRVRQMAELHGRTGGSTIVYLAFVS